MVPEPLNHEWTDIIGVIQTVDLQKNKSGWCGKIYKPLLSLVMKSRQRKRSFRWDAAIILENERHQLHDFGPDVRQLIAQLSLNTSDFKSWSWAPARCIISLDRPPHVWWLTQSFSPSMHLTDDRKPSSSKAILGRMFMLISWQGKK